MFTFTTKMPYLGIFELKFENFVIFETSFLEFIKLENFGKKKQKCLNLGSKIPYFGLLGPKFAQTIVIFQISVLEIVFLQILLQK